MSKIEQANLISTAFDGIKEIALDMESNFQSVRSARDIDRPARLEAYTKAVAENLTALKSAIETIEENL